MTSRNFLLTILTASLIITGCGNKKESPKNNPVSETENTRKPKDYELPPDSLANRNGKNINVVPTMNVPLNEENSVHCSNIEYLWNELMKVSDVRLKSEGLINVLNGSKTWNKTMNINKLILSFGNPDKVYDDVIKQFKEKYNVDNPNLQKKGTTFWGYSYKKLEYKYKEPFDKYPLTFSGTRVNAFGLTSGPNSIYAKQHFHSYFEILYFNYDGEFIVQLKPENTTDQIILVMTKKRDSFKDMFDKAQSLISMGDEEKKKSYDNYRLNAPDELKIPIIRFNTSKEYKELNGLVFSSKYGSIESFEQFINFNFDEKGVVMESTVQVTDSLGGEIKPKMILFNKPFYLYIKEEKAPYPYFNLWVANTGILEKLD